MYANFINKVESAFFDGERFGQHRNHIETAFRVIKKADPKFIDENTLNVVRGYLSTAEKIAKEYDFIDSNHKTLLRGGVNWLK